MVKSEISAAVILYTNPISYCDLFFNFYKNPMGYLEKINLFICSIDRDSINFQVLSVTWGVFESMYIIIFIDFNDWWTGWSIYWFIGLIDWLVDICDWLINWIINWCMIDWSIYLLITVYDRLILIDTMIEFLVD